MQFNTYKTCMKACKNINNCLYEVIQFSYFALTLPVSHYNVYIVSIHGCISFFCWELCVLAIFDVARCDRMIFRFCYHFDIPYRYIYIWEFLLFVHIDVYFHYSAQRSEVTLHVLFHIICRKWRKKTNFLILFVFR